MKRSQINLVIDQAIAFFDEQNWNLPPFASFSPQKWKSIQKNPELGTSYDEVFQKSLGWDVTDFGFGRFNEIGLTLFTIRNGESKGPRTYAEKAMVVGENQVTPWHYHWEKAEDIINRAGGNLVVELYNADPCDNFDPESEWTPGTWDIESHIEILRDGIRMNLKPGEKIVLSPGESVTLTPRLYHTFYGEPGSGKVLVGEVSRVNDDELDNRFYEKLPRYSPVVEDETPRYILCNEYYLYE